jgi:site-specific DNA-methyltransferase (adenine-specific)
MKAKIIRDKALIQRRIRRWAVTQGDCLDVLANMRDESVHAVVCDPPYNLSFMGKHWDTHKSPRHFQEWVEDWAIECLRVLKPGGHMIMFGGSRTFHRAVCGVEDAGFEIRDTLMWLYGSGFPKSTDISKQIDKSLGAKREVVGIGKHPTLKDASKIDRQDTHQFHGKNNIKDEWEITEPATEESKHWEGWGTALKPAHEPILLARKPINGTVVNNVLTHGVGGLNIDACRIELNGDSVSNHSRGKDSAKSKGIYGDSKSQETHTTSGQLLGRWPANIVHDGSEEVLQLFPESSVTGVRSRKSKKMIVKGTQWLNNNHQSVEHTDSGSTARFFYCAKTATKERNLSVENHHPTVKPVALMRWLVRMVTPKGGIVVDPFTGSGSTGIATRLEGHRFFGIEREAEYVKVARERIADYKSYEK